MKCGVVAKSIDYKLPVRLSNRGSRYGVAAVNLQLNLAVSSTKIRTKESQKLAKYLAESHERNDDASKVLVAIEF